MTDDAVSEAPADDVAWLPEPGEIVAGKYAVERVLGHGGMGVVVAATHAQLGNRVAIKYLRPDLVEEPTAMARFLREAKAAVALRGEHVARVQDVGTLESGAPYMIMEFLTGTDLDALLDDRGPLPVDRAVEYVLQASEALAEAHVAGIVHRDLKPGNLCLTQRPDGSPLIKVLDFGIAKALEPEGEQPSKLTQTGTALGTPMYMSPEQIRDAKAVDPRSDIWALGTVLYQLLVGEPPFVADTLPSLCAKIVADAAPDLTRVRPDAPAGLAAVVARCLAKSPADRFENVGELAQALSPMAPDRARVHVERIVRIVAGQGRAESSRGVGADSGSWRAMDAVAATVAAPTDSDAKTTPVLAAGVAGFAMSGESSADADRAQQTAAAWQTRTGSPAGTSAGGTRRRTFVMVSAAAGATLVAAGLAWTLSGRGPSDTPSAEPSSDLVVPAASAQEPLETTTSRASGSEDRVAADAGAAQVDAAPAPARSSAPSVPAPSSRPITAQAPVPSPARTPIVSTTQPASRSKHGTALSDRK